MRPRIPAAVLTVVLLTASAACSSASASPSASSLAHKIPGCGYVTTQTPPVIAKTDVTCLMPDGLEYEVATFDTSTDETQWIAGGGSPSTPDAEYLGCCAQGNGWAADVYDPGPIGTYDFGPLLKALGGRHVS